RAFIGHVVQAVLLERQHSSKLTSQVDCIRRCNDLIVYDTNRLSTLCLSSHRLDEISTFALATGNPVKPACSDNDTPFTYCANQEFTGKFGVSVNAEGKWNRILCVWLL